MRAGAARLFEGCEVAELPVSVTSFLERVYSAFPKPVEISLEDGTEVMLDDALPPGAEIT